MPQSHGPKSSGEFIITGNDGPVCTALKQTYVGVIVTYPQTCGHVVHVFKWEPFWIRPKTCFVLWSSYHWSARA